MEGRERERNPGRGKGMEGVEGREHNPGRGKKGMEGVEGRERV